LTVLESDEVLQTVGVECEVDVEKRLAFWRARAEFEGFLLYEHDFLSCVAYRTELTNGQQI
jgi:hypothetical protein